jgi:predicted DNA-binding transcriptional regulator YafY
MATKDQVTERDVEPHQLFYSDGIWYLDGYCRLRKDIREFRLSRIEKMVALKETFSKRRAGKTGDQKKSAIKIRFAKSIARWVRERQHYGFQSEEVLPDGVVMRYAVHDVSEITAWILGWGAAAEVLSPKELRNSRAKRPKTGRLVDIGLSHVFCRMRGEPIKKGSQNEQPESCHRVCDLHTGRRRG